MSQRRPLPSPEENPRGDYIEAAYHALHANRPDVALRYIEEAMPSGLISMLHQLTGDVR